MPVMTVRAPSGNDPGMSTQSAARSIATAVLVLAGLSMAVAAWLGSAITSVRVAP